MTTRTTTITKASDGVDDDHRTSPSTRTSTTSDSTARRRGRGIAAKAAADAVVAAPRARRQGDEAETLRQRRMNLRRRYKIQDVIRRRQVLLVQVVKEERGNKGAALTTYLSLAGRYCVLMPNTSHGGGISRKISSAADRKRLKSIMADMKLPPSMGCIVRTAGPPAHQGRDQARLRLSRPAVGRDPRETLSRPRRRWSMATAT
jgi:ribonuclease E